VEPVLLAEAKAHLRLDGDAEDNLLGALIAAARVAVEIEIRRVLIAQSWRAIVDVWPEEGVTLPVVPAISVEAVRALDDEGAVTMLDPEDYEFDAADGVGGARPGRRRDALRDRFHRRLRHVRCGCAAATTPGDPAPRHALVRASLGGGAERPRRRAAARLPRAGGALPEARAVLSERGASEPGRLRIRLVLEKPTPIPDGAGGSSLNWDAVATIAADVRPLKAEERISGEGFLDVTLHEIVIRYRDDVSPGDRFKLGERVLRIAGVTDPDEDGRYLVCRCEEERQP
jgi:SPP1 family predicted phage head-tail adaptor